ncbi:hypothetical protein QTP88_006792 [Uroleucon formosanum]
MINRCFTRDGTRDMRVPGTAKFKFRFQTQGSHLCSVCDGIIGAGDMTLYLFCDVETSRSVEVIKRNLYAYLMVNSVTKSITSRSSALAICRDTGGVIYMVDTRAIFYDSLTSSLCLCFYSINYQTYTLYVVICIHYHYCRQVSYNHINYNIIYLSQLSQCGPPCAKKRINWKKFQIELTPRIKNSRISTISDINKNIDKLTKTIQSECEKCSYIVNQPESSKPLPDDILLEINTKRLLRKNWQRTRDPRTKALYNAQVSHVKNILTRHRISEWHSFTSTPYLQNKSIYKLIRRLLHKPPSYQPLKTTDGNKIYDSKSKAELFADTMYTQFQNNPDPPLPESNYPKSTRFQGSLISYTKSKQHGTYSSKIINLQNLSKTYSSICSTNLETPHWQAYVDQDRGLPKLLTTYYNRRPLPGYKPKYTKFDKHTTHPGRSTKTI